MPDLQTNLFGSLLTPGAKKELESSCSRCLTRDVVYVESCLRCTSRHIARSLQRDQVAMIRNTLQGLQQEQRKAFLQAIDAEVAKDRGLRNG